MNGETLCLQDEMAALADAWNGGADRNRTCDLLIANETLYQLSYDPNQFIQNYLRGKSLGDDLPLLHVS